MSFSHDRDDQDSSLMASAQYMCFVRWTPRLTDEEEAQLFDRIERGKEEQTQAYPDPRILQEARQARDRLVEGYQPLILHYAKKYRHRFHRLEMLDLIQEGNLGLLRAIADHEPNKGHFTGLASVCTRQAMWLAYYDSERFIRVSQKVRVRLSKMGKVERQLLVALDREPTATELAEAMGKAEQEMDDLLIWREQGEVESLHQLLYDEEAEDKYVFVNVFEGQQESAGDVDREVAVQQAISEALSPRQQQVVHWRYGFDGETGQRRTCVDVAERLGVSFTLVARYDRQARQQLQRVLAHLVGLTQEEGEGIS